MTEKYFVYVSTHIRKSLLKIPSPWIERIEKAIDALELNPYFGEKMNGDMSHSRKIKVWPYRIIYKIEKKERVIKITEASHRGGMSYR
ncbi:MAG: type II toxin-antitoxin system RelE/ParE family toxin [bacterium]|nr:type II toxin-antitoxin system RelE/ParE family toxin [bacterium]